MKTKWNFLTILALLVMLLGGNVTPAQAADGDLDPTFGTGGVLVTDTSTFLGWFFTQHEHASTQQSDGKIIVGGYYLPAIAIDVSPQAELARYSADGVLDGDFGTGGKIHPQVPGTVASYVSGVHTGPEDEIIAVGGYGDYGISHIYLARYDGAGEPVAGFGTDGVLPVALPSDLAMAAPFGSALQSDGKVLVAGMATIPNETGDPQPASFLMRLDAANGTLDPTFGSGGMVLDPDDMYAFQKITLQSGGKILVTNGPGSGSFIIHRFTSTGVPDEGFGLNGVSELPGAQFQCSALAEGPEGKLYLTVGPIGSSASESDFFLARLNADGSPDPAFGTLGNGSVFTDFASGEDRSCSLLVQADGKVIVGGGATDADGYPGLALARYSVDGALDESFGSGGKVITTDLYGLVTELAMTPGGKLLTTGLTFDGTNYYTALARYNLVESTNTAPVANPGGPYLGPINTAISFDGSGSSDTDGDPLTYAWTFGDGGASTEAAPSHSYTAAGVYDVCLTVNDGALNSEPTCTLAVVYDPSGGFVTGGGWIDSPAGAYIPDPSLSGKATFGFVSKYHKGAAVPTGNTEFQFQAGSFNFHSTSYEWLVVNRSEMNAQFKGSGTVNGALDPNGNAYKFMLWAGDGTLDTFRIRIWWEGADAVENVVYDNGFDQAIGGGSIVVHTGK